MTDFAHYEKEWQKGYYEGFDEGYMKGKKDAAPKWIPVSSGNLPDVQHNVMLSTIFGVAEGVLIDKHEEPFPEKGVVCMWKQFRWDAILYNNQVTAWATMPKPYDGEEE